MTAPSTAVSAAIPLAIVAEPIHDRAWWTEESARVGTGWPVIIDAALEIMVAGGIVEPEPDTIPLGTPRPGTGPPSNITAIGRAVSPSRSNRSGSRDCVASWPTMCRSSARGGKFRNFPKGI